MIALIRPALTIASVAYVGYQFYRKRQNRAIREGLRSDLANLESEADRYDGLVSELVSLSSDGVDWAATSLDAGTVLAALTAVQQSPANVRTFIVDAGEYPFDELSDGEIVDIRKEAEIMLDELLVANETLDEVICALADTVNA